KLFNNSHFRVKVIEPYQMLGEVDMEMIKLLELDVIGVPTPGTMFGFNNENWKSFKFNHTEVLVPGSFNYTRDNSGAYYMYPEGDITINACAKMPGNGYFFDAVSRQHPMDENNLNPEDNCEEFGILSEEDLKYYAETTRKFYNETDLGIYVTLPGMAFGDIALVPATWMKNPKGIRDVEEWYMSLLMRTDYIHKIFERQCEIALKNIELLAKAIGNHAQIVFLSGTDFGTQNGLFSSIESYRNLFKPYQKALNDKIHQLTNWKTFIHSCGAIYELIPDLIDAGFDVLNPVQISATGMDPKKLKNEFGKDIVFWGGGINTQHTLPFGTPEDVYKEVIRNVEIFNDGGGYIFNPVHNVQSNVPVENIIAMFNALNDVRGITKHF
ncbi:MAG: methyltransferase, partial [Bacteroidales bacterium]|nr:methyltransferase [Bacteroidales bacterium]